MTNDEAIKTMAEAGGIPEDKVRFIFGQALTHEADRLSELALVHARSGSRDDYGHGLYNGLKVAIACLNGGVIETLSRDEYLALYGDSVPCSGCGKPMEDRGAEMQWCPVCAKAKCGDSKS